jgi:hypothetical protein
MATKTPRFECIFQSQNGKNRTWLDYCRETAPTTSIAEAEQWANTQARLLQNRIGCPCRVRVEDWSDYC